MNKTAPIHFIQLNDCFWPLSAYQHGEKKERQPLPLFSPALKFDYSRDFTYFTPLYRCTYVHYSSRMSEDQKDNNWPKAIAHIDADCFFASCELVRRPKLRGTPVCVLSSQDACVVAKTYDAKAVGIKTGMPIWEAKKLLPNATYLSADFRFYGLISNKMFSILRRFSPDIEVYSIDEGFIDLNGTRLLLQNDFKGIAHDIRRTVQREVGITVSVGVSVTRILAKMASEYNKPNGVTIVPHSLIHQFLERTELSDITGIGRNREALLHKFKIHTPLDYVNTDIKIIQRLLGKAGTDLWYELHGTSVMGLELHPATPKSVSRTASLGEVTSDRRAIASHLTRHTTRLATELVTKKLLAKRLTIFIRNKEFHSVSAQTDFEHPTNNYFRFSRSIQSMINELYVTGEQYRACGVIAEKISKVEETQYDLFGQMKSDAKQSDLLATVDKLNKRYGSNTVKMAGAIKAKKSGVQVRFMYPMIIAS